MAQIDTDFSISPGETVSPTAAPQPSYNASSSHSPSDSASANATRTTPPANGVNGASGLNSRSCITCRKRKVRCDKRHPCSNCNRAAIECVFPGPGRAPRRSRKPENQELLARLRRLEGVVQKFQKGVDENGMTIIENVEAEGTSPQAAVPCGKDKIKQEDLCLPSLYEPNWKSDLKNGATHGDATAGVTKEFGRLVVEDGRSRYVSNKFWSSLSEEVMEMRDILDDPTDDDDDYPSPGSGSDATANHQGFIFSFSSTVLSLRNFHPTRDQIPIYWDIYKSNIDPVIKLLHIPYHQKIFYKAAQDLDNVSKPMEVFMLTIYYAAVTSLSPNDCIMRLGLEKQQTLRKYRFATEQALARTGFLNTQEFIVLQAMLLFLTCARRSDDTRYVWTITGLLIRLAQAQGCHRDGQQFGLSPFETEMRRRLWWQICTLDVRASEDHGSDPTIMEQNFDTRLPLNINDEDISPEMTQAPEEHEGATEMTFDLIRFSVSTTVRRMSYAPPGLGHCKIKSNLTLEDKEKKIDDLHQYLERKYLKYLDMSIPLHWVAALVARLIMAKMWLVVHHPLSRNDLGAGLSQEVKDRLFHTSVEVIEFSRLLETDRSTLKWGWLFRTYVQWHALAFVLSELCFRTTGPAVEKAWAVIESALADEETHISSNQRGMLWKPLRKLLIKAKAGRKKGLPNQSRFPLDGSIGPNVPSLGIPPGPMSTMNGITDFVAFDTSSSIDGFPAMMTSQSMNPNGLGQQQYPQMDQMQSNGMVDPASYLLDPAVFSQDRPIVDETMNWTGWDDMMKDYQMDGTNGQGGMPKDGMFNWM